MSPGPALAQQKAPQPLPGAPWAAPVLPPASQKPAPAAKAPLPPEKLRPAAENLLDCRQAPAAAVTKVPDAISRWATIYCTRQGHILTTNEKFYSVVPGTRGQIRGVLNAADIGGRKGQLGHGAYFTRIEYAPLDPKVAKQIQAGIDPMVQKIIDGKALFQLSLTVDNGRSYRGVVVDPTTDPFWVIPIIDGKLARAGFSVATVEYVNRARTQ
jgi:hypothetical protein